jgi:hypothetical protein
VVADNKKGVVSQLVGKSSGLNFSHHKKSTFHEILHSASDLDKVFETAHARENNTIFETWN